MTRSRRVQLLAGVIALAVVAAIAAAILGHSSSKSPVQAVTTATATTGGQSTGTATTTATTTTPTRISGPAAIKALFAGIPQHGDTLGKASAPVSLLVFEDPQCPYCDEWTLDTLPTVLTQFVRTGKVKLVYRGVLVIGPNSGPGLRAIVAAGLQNRLWNMNEALYANQGKENSGWITPGLVVALAADLGLDSKKLLTDANSTAVTNILTAAGKEAEADNVQGTPSFVILHPPAAPQQLNESSLEPAGFVEALTAAIG